MKSFVYLLAALMVAVLCASPALATGHGQQAVIVQEYVVAQPLVQSYVVQQQNAACVAQQFNAYSAPLQQQQFIVRQQAFKQQGFQRSRSRQQFNSGGRQRSLSIQSSSSGRGGLLRNILPF